MVKKKTTVQFMLKVLFNKTDDGDVFQRVLFEVKYAQYMSRE